LKIIEDISTFYQFGLYVEILSSAKTMFYHDLLC